MPSSAGRGDQVRNSSTIKYHSALKRSIRIGTIPVKCLQLLGAVLHFLPVRIRYAIGLPSIALACRAETLQVWNNIAQTSQPSGNTPQSSLKRRRKSSPPSTTRQPPIPGTSLPSPFTSAPLPKRPPRLNPAASISPHLLLHLAIPETLIIARAESANWVSGWHILSGNGISQEASQVAVSIAERFPTDQVGIELQRYRQVVRSAYIASNAPQSEREISTWHQHTVIHRRSSHCHYS